MKNIWNCALLLIVVPEIRGYRKAAAELGLKATLSCEVYSNPAASSITIWRNGVPLESSPFITISPIEYAVDGLEYKQRLDVTFQEVNVSDYGQYTCKAQNVIDEVQKELTLQRPSK